MKILTAEQVRAWDKYTVANEPISSFDLMERAALAFTYWFTNIYDSEKNIFVFCGTGNNGGDGLAIARLLHQRFFNVQVFICKISKNETPDFKKNLEILPHRAEILRGYMNEGDAFPPIEKDAIIIDAILGSGLTRPVQSYWTDFFQYLNTHENEIVAVDIPSGLFSDCHTPKGTIDNEGKVQPERINCIQADRVFSFEIPKLAFLMPENQQVIKHFDFKSIRLKSEFLEQIEPHNLYITEDMASNLLKKRHKFSHKGTYGHALLVCGSLGMAGAAILSARACLRSGVGLLTIHTPQCNRLILQTAVPEAMCIEDAINDVVTHIEDCLSCNTIGIGCGLGKDKRTVKALRDLLKNYTNPMVIDADALNIISENKDLLKCLPANSILTPHPKEFERLFGISNNDFDRLELLREQAKSLNINILLKGAHTIVANTEGVCFFNSTGNAGMATAGSGDVLTGIITALLAQGYEPISAAVLGIYLHGLAGDLAADRVGQEALIASDIIENLGAAFKKIQNKMP